MEVSEVSYSTVLFSEATYLTEQSHKASNCTTEVSEVIPPIVMALVSYSSGSSTVQPADASFSTVDVAEGSFFTVDESGAEKLPFRSTTRL